MGLILLPGKRWDGYTEPVNGDRNKIAMRFENGPNNGTDFINQGSSAAPFTKLGTPKIISALKRFGTFAGDFRTGSLKFDPRLDHVLGSQDFTIEMNVYCTARNSVDTFALVSTTGADFNWAVQLGNTLYNSLPFFLTPKFAPANNGYHWGGQIGYGTTALTLNTWVHLSVTRFGGEIYTHRNGVYQPSSLFSVGAGIPIEPDPSKPATLVLAANQNMVLDDVWMHVGAAWRAKSNFTVAAL